jgi:cleavage stimulation factor subunit 2
MVRHWCPLSGFLPHRKLGELTLNLGITEEQIVETLERVGQVVNFRLVYDKETGRPKGFGFAEFADGDAAASAVRNLNDYEIMNRKLRVDWSNDNGAGDSAPATYAPPAPPNGMPEPAAPAQNSTLLPPLPPGKPLEPELTSAEAISRTLQTLPPPQLLDILTQMKGLVMSQPERATELFHQAPQLAYALFQALLLLNLVDGNVLKQVIEPAPGAAQQPAAAPPPAAHAPQPPQQSYPGYPPQPVPTPPVQQPYAPPPPAMPPQLANLTPEQRQQYAAILQLPPDVVNSLPPDQRAGVMEVRKMFGLPAI